MAANSYPQTSDISEGMRRRLQVVPFDRNFSEAEADPTLFLKIWQNELPGVANRAIQGLKRLRERGCFKVPADCERAKEEFLAQANPLIAFIKDQCTHDSNGRIRLKDFREVMKAWAKDQGLRQPPADNSLKRKLKGLGYKVSMVKGYAQVFSLDWNKTS